MLQSFLLRTLSQRGMSDCIGFAWLGYWEFTLTAWVVSVAAVRVLLLQNKECHIGWEMLFRLLMRYMGYICSLVLSAYFYWNLRSGCLFNSWFFIFVSINWRKLWHCGIVFLKHQLLTQHLVPYSENQGDIRNWDISHWKHWAYWPCCNKESKRGFSHLHEWHEWTYSTILHFYITVK